MAPEVKADVAQLVFLGPITSIPGFAVFDDGAREAVAEAVADIGQEVQVREIAVTAAMVGAVPRGVITQLTEEFNRTGQLPLPVVLVNGEALAYGIPVDKEKISAALKRAAEEQLEV